MQPICTHKISVQSSKPSHAYPIIRLPCEFRRLAGSAATIYKTTNNGALAFLVVHNELNSQLVVPKGLKGHKRNLDTDPNVRSLEMAEVAGPNPAEPIVNPSCVFAAPRCEQRLVSTQRVRGPADIDKPHS